MMFTVIFKPVKGLDLITDQLLVRNIFVLTISQNVQQIHFDTRML